MLRVTDLDIVINLNIASCYRARTFLGQGDFSFVLAVHHKGNTLEVQQDLNNIFLYALDGRVLMQYSIDFDFGDRAAGHGRQQNTTQGIAQRVAKATLQRLQSYLGAGSALLIDVDLVRSQ